MKKQDKNLKLCLVKKMKNSIGKKRDEAMNVGLNEANNPFHTCYQSPNCKDVLNLIFLKADFNKNSAQI